MRWGHAVWKAWDWAKRENGDAVSSRKGCHVEMGGILLRVALRAKAVSQRGKQLSTLVAWISVHGASLMGCCGKWSYPITLFLGAQRQNGGEFSKWSRKSPPTLNLNLNQRQWRYLGKTETPWEAKYRLKPNEGDQNCFSSPKEFVSRTLPKRPQLGCHWSRSFNMFMMEILYAPLLDVLLFLLFSNRQGWFILNEQLIKLICVWMCHGVPANTNVLTNVLK